MKLDMSKAYDCVEWLFLKEMMLKLGFNPVWMKLIMKCVSSMAHRIKLNGDLSVCFLPERGLRQGDPLSPYLFLICAEGFPALLNKTEEEEGRMQGSKYVGALRVYHIFYLPMTH